MAYYTSAWFWLLIIGIILIIIAIIGFLATVGFTTPTKSSVPIWIWVVGGIGLLFIIIAIIVAAVSYYREPVPTTAVITPTAPPLPAPLPATAPMASTFTVQGPPKVIQQETTYAVAPINQTVIPGATVPAVREVAVPVTRTVPQTVITETAIPPLPPQYVREVTTTGHVPVGAPKTYITETTTQIPNLMRETTLTTQIPPSATATETITNAPQRTAQQIARIKSLQQSSLMRPVTSVS